ncbi:MAG: helix-turn-helix transcriptional regulator [Planctomycetota bacterium]|jgi:ribosome-binding protein aMBF1 (putative translation factor)
MAKKKTSDALKIIDRITGDDPIRRAAIEHEILNSKISRIVYDLRTKAGLTQKTLADLIGTKQSAISRLENADYEGHTIGMLLRIAFALNTRVTLHLNPKGKTPVTV